MIVMCPACQARYKVDDAKIKGRGAKISCPKCQHIFVVYKDAGGGGQHGAAALADRDFRGVGVTWQVRRGIGLVESFHDLATLHEQMEEGEIDVKDAISYDMGRTWTLISAISDLDALFEEVWERAKRGEIDTAPVDHSRDEDDEDSPTTIVNRNAELADAIRRAVAESGTPSERTAEAQLPHEESDETEDAAVVPAQAPAPPVLKSGPSVPPPVVKPSASAPQTNAQKAPSNLPIIIFGGLILVVLAIAAAALI